MSKLSPTYRNDDVRGLPKDIKDYLDQNYFKSLPNIDKTNPKLLVVFSGGNAMGKTVISRAIALSLSAIVLENDEIKFFIKKFNSNLSKDELSKFTWQYSMDLYSRLSELTPNGLIVRDGVIDWYYDRILPVFEEQDYKLFIIGFDISVYLKKELIKNRGDKPMVKADRLIELIPEHDFHIKRFRAVYESDVMLKDDNLFSSEEYVLARIKQALNG